ncbi:MAG: SHOCT domain-containing protein [Reyranella sp.]
MHIVNGPWLWGMHVLWWLFWFVVIALFFSLLTPVPRARIRETPLQILQRRYAAGEVTTAEYEERKALLERDSPSGKT